MKSFRFNLEKVLRIRERETTIAQNHLAIAQVEAAQAREKLDRAVAERKAFAAEMLAQRLRRITAQQLAFAGMQHEGFMDAETAASDLLQQALERVVVRRNELADVKRRQKTLEKLRERQFEDWQYQANAAEQQSIDEMAQTQMRRLKGGGL